MLAALQALPCYNGKGWKGQGEVGSGRKAPAPGVRAGYFQERGLCWSWISALG